MLNKEIIPNFTTKFQKLPISVVMVIYNEERIIERALRSFFDIVDEIIIVHDGKCTDTSLEIARKYTDNIFELEHIGEAERHRPFTLQKARNDWVLQIDADQYLSDGLRDNLKDLIMRNVDIYDVLTSICYQGTHYYFFYGRVLFRKSKIYFIGVSHESVKPLNEKVRIGKADYVIMHAPLYENLSLSVFKKKWRAWAELQAKQLLEDFSDIPKWNCTLSDWEPNRKIRISYPILLGMIGTSLYNIPSHIKLFLIHRKFFIIKLGFFSFMYNFYLYHYIWFFKKENIFKRLKR